MNHLRRALGPIAALWLMSQAGSFVMVPVALWAFAAGDLSECTCAHGDHATCPMHHKPAIPSKTCVIRSADHSETAVLTFMLTLVGVLTPSAHDVISPSTPSIVRSVVASPSGRPTPPDPPPPRA
jgi:hypothetical protein